MGAMMSNASTLAKVGMGLNAFGSLLGASGQAQEGNTAADAYVFQAQIAANNARIARENEAAGLTAAGINEGYKKLESGQLVGAQRAAQAANGIKVDQGSPADVRDSTALVGSLDAALMHFNAAREAYGLESEAGALDQQSDLYRRAASNVKSAGKSKALATIIGGAASVFGKWAQYQQAFSKPADSMKGLY
jgi:hypothetical protein